jgi:hypothetical protein
MPKKSLTTALLVFLAVSAFRAHERQSFQLQVLVDGSSVPQYHHAGKVYIEALKDREYTIRLSNPLNARVAVALAVDGLNSIDARNTDAFSAKKWVLEPYETIVIEGWQVNQQQARKFFFTSEEKSYGQWLGKTQNLGVISAVFFRERPPWAPSSGPSNRPVPMEEGQTESRPADRDATAAAPKSSAEPAGQTGSSISRREKKDDYAATGIGRRMDHQVYWVSMDLDPTPVATLNLRYEFRPVLARLGILPTVASVGPLNRREQARGFKDSAFCPEPQ